MVSLAISDTRNQPKSLVWDLQIKRDQHTLMIEVDCLFITSGLTITGVSVMTF